MRCPTWCCSVTCRRRRFPTVDGYNLTYLRPGATMGVVTTDEYRAPVLAFWHRGLGRVASLTAEVDGKYSRRLNAWQGSRAFAVGLGRWVLGGEPPTGVQASDRAAMAARASSASSSIPARPRSGAEAKCARPRRRSCRRTTGGGGASQRLTLSWVGEDTLEARFPVQKAGLYLGAVQLGTGGVLPLAPLSLPVLAGVRAAADPDEGRKTLTRDGANHRRNRSHGVGRRVRREPAAEPPGARSGVAARAGAARAARCRNRRTAAAAVRRGERVAAIPALAAVAPHPRRSLPLCQRRSRLRRHSRRHTSPRRRQSPRRRRWRGRKRRRGTG